MAAPDPVCRFAPQGQGVNLSRCEGAYLISKLTQRYDKVKTYSDLPDITLQQIQHFFD
jgi:hypothetical protein